MILSVSRRTDIPAFYPEWFFDKIEKQSLCVRNPMRKDQVSRISLDPSVIDCIVFWTKNPARMIPKLGLLSRYEYYFTYTLNYYGPDLEPNLPDVKSRIETFIGLSNKIAKARVIWRYDPIVITNNYTPEWHARCFATLCEILAPYTEKAVVSIVDVYQGKNYPRLAAAGFRNIQYDEKMKMFKSMAASARKNNIKIATCAENMPELEKFGIEKNSCVDRELIERLLCGTKLIIPPADQRPSCGCASSIDVGCYGSCAHDCAYCYANSEPSKILSRIAAYDPESPILCDRIRPGDIISDRQMHSCKEDDVPF